MSPPDRSSPTVNVITINIHINFIDCHILLVSKKLDVSHLSLRCECEVHACQYVITMFSPSAAYILNEHDQQVSAVDQCFLPATSKAAFIS